MYSLSLADNQFGKRDNELREGSLAEERGGGGVSSEWKSATARGTKAACLTGIDPVPGIKLSRCSKPVMACPSGTRWNNIKHYGQYYQIGKGRSRVEIL